MKKLLWLVLFAMPHSASAATITLDFEQYAGSVNTFYPLDSNLSLGNGFTLARVGTVVWLTDGAGPEPGSVMIAITDGNNSVTLTQGGNSFNLLEFDFAFIPLTTGPVAGTVLLSGFKSGGQQVSLSLNYADYPFTSSLGTWVDNGGLFTDLVSANLAWTSGNAAVAIDNIVVSAVPIPAAVWLFASALAGLGWMRRKS